MRCGISMSSTCERVSIRRSSSKYDQSAYARRTTTRPRSASASAIGREVEGHAAKVVAGPERQVLVVEEQGDAFFVGVHERTAYPPAARRAGQGQSAAPKSRNAASTRRNARFGRDAADGSDRRPKRTRTQFTPGC